MRKMRVYTAGYMHGRNIDRHAWRESLEAACQESPIDWLHPGVFPGDIPGKGNPRNYAARDQLLIQRCDVVFAYFDIAVARCLGAAAEVGYAWGLGKLIIMLNANEETYECGSLDLCRAWTHSEWCSYKEAVDQLKFLADGFRP